MNLLTPNREALLKKWAHVIEATKHIRTWTSDAELSWLADYATWCSNFCEIGSYRGRSAKVMLMANPGLNITCLDTWDDAGTFEEFQHNLGPEIAAGRVTMDHRPSQQTLKVMNPEFVIFDGCFIDGGHEEYLVRADIEGLRPLMKAGSLMAGHDFYPKDNNDVARGVLSLIPNPSNPIDSIWAVQL